MSTEGYLITVSMENDKAGGPCGNCGKPTDNLVPWTSDMPTHIGNDTPALLRGTQLRACCPECVALGDAILPEYCVFIDGEVFCEYPEGYRSPERTS